MRVHLIPLILAGYIVAALISCQSAPEPYGCSTDLGLSNGNGTINGRFYAHNTGLALHAGDRLAITAWGTVCWDDKTCSSPLGDIGSTYGLYIRIGDSIPFYIGKTFDKPVGHPGTLYFIIPEGNMIDTCDEELYRDNSGRYEVSVAVNGK